MMKELNHSKATTSSQSTEELSIRKSIEPILSVSVAEKSELVKKLEESQLKN